MHIEQRFIELPIHQCSENSRYYWVNSSVLEKMWRRDPNGSYIPEWTGPPHSNFFSMDASGKNLYVAIPCIQLIVSPDGEHSVYVQGRGKVLRWLLNRRSERVPVAVYRDIGIDKVGTGIIWSRVEPWDRVGVRNDFDPNAILDEKLAQQRLVDNFAAREIFSRIREHVNTRG